MKACWALAALCLCVAACGETTDDPPLFPEARFEVIPQGGEATFTVVELSGGGVLHTFPSGTELSATSIFNFFIENSPSPFTGQFMQTGDVPITVKLTVTGVQAQFATSAGPGTIASVSLGTITAPPVPQSPEVRLEVCAPAVASVGCIAVPAPGTAPNPGVFGITYTGTIGDEVISVELFRPSSTADPLGVPSVYFFQSPQESINAVFRSDFVQLLEAQLIIDGVQQQSASSTTDVVLRKDL